MSDSSYHMINLTPELSQFNCASTQVKYKKKKTKNGQMRQGPQSPDKIKMQGFEPMMMESSGMPSNGLPNGLTPSVSRNSPISVPSSGGLLNGAITSGNILKTALTNPAEVSQQSYIWYT